MDELTNPPNNDKPALPPAAVIICGFLAGIVITVLLICVLLCKMKIHKVKRYRIRRAQQEIPKKPQAGIQYTRSKGNADVNVAQKVSRWRSGYGKGCDVTVNGFSESDCEASSERTTSTSYDLSVQNDVMLTSPSGKLVIVKEETTTKPTVMVKPENEERESSISSKNGSSDKSGSKKSSAKVINQITTAQEMDFQKWDVVQQRIGSLGCEGSFKQQGNTHTVLHVKPAALPQQAYFETKSIIYSHGNVITTNGSPP